VKIRALAVRLAAGCTAAIALSGCAAGLNATTNQPYNPGGYGVEGSAGSLKLRTVLIVAPPAGGTDALLLGSISNDGAEGDVITSVSVTTRQGAPATQRVTAAGSLALPRFGALRMGPGSVRGVPDPTLAATLTFVGFTPPAGEFVAVTFSFQVAPSVTLAVRVVPATGVYATVTPGPSTPGPSTPGP
jgi:hypothetical protein